MDEFNTEIRPLQVSDAYTSVKWRNDKEIWLNTINSPDRVITIEDELNWIEKVINEKDSHRFAILVNNEYIGNIQLTNIKNDESYFGIFIGNKNYWNKGIGAVATLKILKFAFENVNLKRVNLRVRKNNLCAIRLYQNIGFKTIKELNDIIHMQISSNDFKS